MKAKVCMDPQTLRQVRGAAELITDMVDGTTVTVADAHLAIAARTYAIVGQVGPLAGPSLAIGEAQATITRGVYAAVRATNRLVRMAAVGLLDRFEEPA